VISAGFENSYGHPHRDVIERLEQRHAAVFRTDLDGLTPVRKDGWRMFV
jgi:competence protein ComEC